MPHIFDFTFPPFDALSELERRNLAQQVDIEYYAAGSPIIQAHHPMPALYVVMKGLVVSGGEQDVFIAEHDWFDGKGLLEGHCAHDFTAQEDTLLWAIPRSTVLQLSQNNPTFAAYFYQDVARRMAELAPSPQQFSQATLMLSRVRDASINKIHELSAQASVLDAARCLQDNHISSLLVQCTNGQRGMFTQSDLRRVVAQGLIPAQTLAADHASCQLHCINAEQTLHQAMITMIRQGIHHILVEEHGEIIGVLEQIGLLSSLANNPHSIGVQIERANSFAELKAASDRFVPLIQLLQHNGMKVTLIAELISELRQKLLAKLFTLLAPPHMLEHVCLLVLGSEGRGEQILRTDQDNALIIADGYSHPELESISQRFNAALLELGYPLCPGGIMLNSPNWRKTVSEFKQQINAWTYTPSAENMMNLAIWSDGVAVIGNTSLLYELQSHLYKWLDGNTTFMSHFARPLEQFPMPGLFSRLLNRGETLDLKKSAIFAITHGLRSLALEARIDARNSYQRLAALSHSPMFTASQAQDLAESLSFLQNLQLKYGLQAHLSGKTSLNLIEPSQLSALERELLKDAFGVIKAFRVRLRHHFKLDQL